MNTLHTKAGWLCFAYLATFFYASSAEAHLMAAEQGSINVAGESVFAVLSVPVSALHEFDDDADGLLSLPELARHKATLRREIDERFVLADGGTLGRTEAIDLVLSPQHDARPDRSSEVVVLKHTRFPAAPTDVVVSCDLFGSEDRERQITITATRLSLPRRVDASDERVTEAAVFTPRASEHHFFRPRTAAFVDYVKFGTEHLRFGAAPLLGLLTVIVAATGWRYGSASSRRRYAPARRVGFKAHTPLPP